MVVDRGNPSGNWGLDLFGLHPRERPVELWTWQMGDLGAGEEFVPDMAWTEDRGSM